MLPSLIQSLTSAGVLHMVYGTTDHQGYYTQSRDNGGTWTTAVKLNDNRNVTTTMGEREFRLSLHSASLSSARCVQAAPKSPWDRTA
jgi:hypothetical protein